MVKVFKESHEKDVERLASDLVWTLDMFQMLTGDYLFGLPEICWSSTVIRGWIRVTKKKLVIIEV
jgi:hypothetical protein